jgi:hypothetical protein
MKDVDIEGVKQLLKRIAPGEWSWSAGAGGSLDPKEQRDWLIGCYDNTPRGTPREIMLVHVPGHTIAITGNGEHGEINAAFIASAPRIISDLLKEVDRLKAENNVLKAVNRLNEDGLG